jgi:hypothetical protein
MSSTAIIVAWFHRKPQSIMKSFCRRFLQFNNKLDVNSEPFGFSTIVTYSSGGCWSV